MTGTDHQCSDPHWQAVLAQLDAPFEELTDQEKIDALNALNRRRSLMDDETDLLCDLLGMPQKKRRDAKGAQRFTPEEDARLLSMRRKGANWREIGREIGRDRNSIKARWKRLTREPAAQAA